MKCQMVGCDAAGHLRLRHVGLAGVMLKYGASYLCDAHQDAPLCVDPGRPITDADLMAAGDVATHKRPSVRHLLEPK